VHYRFNLVARAVENALSDTHLESFESVESTSSVEAAECADLVLVVAAVCHRQIVLPRYSSAQVCALCENQQAQVREKTTENIIHTLIRTYMSY